MPSKVKDQATAEFAARNLNKGTEVAEKSEPKTPADKTTTERLFPEFVTDDGGIVNRPVKPFEDKSKPLPVAATPAAEPQHQTPQPPTTTPPVTLKLEDLTGKMIVTKVDGVETAVPAEQALKSIQLERHLNAQLMKLAEERATFEKERTQLRSQTPVQAPEPTADPRKQPAKAPEGSRSPNEDALQQRISSLEAMINQLGTAVGPALRETGLKRLDSEVKQRLGADDFMQYAPRIEELVNAELAKPENAVNPQARQVLLSSGYWFDQYKEMKLRDLITKPAPQASGPVSTTPALQPIQGAPVVVTNQGQPVSIPNIEGSGGVPSKGSSDSGWQSRAQGAFDTARQSGRTEDWMAYYRLKSEGA